MQGMWHMREKENAYWHLAGKLKRKRATCEIRV
jgi:hypothetical protein